MACPDPSRSAGGSVASIRAASDQNLTLGSVQRQGRDLPVIESEPCDDREENGLFPRKEFRPAMADLGFLQGSQLLRRASGGGDFPEFSCISGTKHDRII